MLKLTAEEQALYTRKRDTIINFVNMFSSYFNIYDSIIYRFTIKELLSEDFRKNLFPKITTWVRADYSHILYNAVTNKNTISQVTKEECKEAYEFLLELFKTYPRHKRYDDKNYISFNDSVNTLKVLRVNGAVESDFATDLFNTGFFEGFTYENDSIIRYLDTLFSTEKIDDIDLVIKTVQKQYPTYLNFPLVILNPNVDSATKIKAVKLTYRQKDLPKYIKSFKSNLKDLNDIDAFIEATIIQNNRVKEKEDNIVKIFKSVFIDGSWDKINLDNLKHREEFSLKYLHNYFLNKDFIRKFYVDTVDSLYTMQYERKEQFKSFMRLIYSSATIDETITGMAASSALRCVSSRIIEIFQNSIRERIEEHNTLNENPEFKPVEEENKILSAVINWIDPNEDRAHFRNFLDDEVNQYIFKNLDEFPSIMEYFNKKYKYIYNYSKIATVHNKYDDQYFKLSDLPYKYFSHVTFGPDEVLNCLGFSCTLLEKRERDFSTWDTTKDIDNAMTELYYALKSSVLNSANRGEQLETVKYIIENIFKRFEDSSVTDTMIDEFIAIAQSKNSRITSLGYYSSSTKTIDAAMSQVKTWCQFANELYTLMGQTDPSYLERYKTLEENFENVKDSVSLICNI